MKKTKLILGIFLFPFSLMAEGPILIFNSPNVQELPGEFRSTSLIPNGKIPDKISTEGLDTLNISGSAQYSEEQFSTIKRTIPNLDFVFDLRQESHGFLNGIAISWLAPKNWINLGLTESQVIQEEESLLNSLKNMKTVEVYRLAKEADKVNATVKLWDTIRPKNVLNEAEIIKQKKLTYYRIYVADDRPPLDSEVDRFVPFWENVPRNKAVHFHCENGHGRTTTFMVMADILESAKIVSLSDIFARQAAMGGVDLTKLPPLDNYAHPYSQERLEFLKKFYEYAKSTTKPRPLWSEWKKTN
ncbi:Protein-tyrosine phosphatase family protein [Candidatus Bealeia paramacronuclearis]|uniref:Protein-tyrosine phosphatase family protein n=1 Tax=Candidatus Bealeia paramacronuclearis TaxID=1921001 RepID=A0ABZ2C474_9PROT|nr:Protein-tyrosine phosphatase family protein [Candidatus Bealeia paramacronuclearis]